jgi:MYXO-CTERM domain-containing protein
MGVSSIALAGPPDDVEGEPLDPEVYLGENVSPCGWPTVVAVTSQQGYLCTGTLVHPRVVIFAAHCGAGSRTIRFGESAWNGGVGINANCQTNPSYDQSQATDWGFCVLDQEVTQLPIAPVLFGCELEQLVPQSEVAVVGFGKNTNAGGDGTKRWALTTLQYVDIDGNTTGVGGGGEPSICPGDSGGPAFIKGDDGIWRVFGIASTVNLGPNGEDCGGLGTHSIVAGAVEWIEEASGYDITPCHDQQGNWYPGPDCTEFFGSANNSYGNWGNWCAGTPASPPPSTCGPALGSNPETNPPVVNILSPAEDFESADLPTIFDIVMDAYDDSGFLTIWLRINGMDITNVMDSEPPWQINNVTLPEGAYEIVAVAEDFYGNQGLSEPLNVIVGNPPAGDGDGDPTGGDGDGDPTGGDGDGDSTGGGLTGGFDTFGGIPSDDPSGCSCSAGETVPGVLGFSLLGLLALVRRRRDSLLPP